MSSSGGIGTTLTGGIQDIAGILPLLGTEQCAIHVTSALTHGFLYAASAPMSIFGSLGVVSAGFKTFVACFSFGDFEGADLLENMGFEPQGENLSLIMYDGRKEENERRYVIQNRIDKLMEDLNVDENRIIGVSHNLKSPSWNIAMMLTTAFLCVLSITPYIYINLRANDLDLKKGTIWAFPILRSTGGFITATLIQLLIQRRITTLSHQYLVKRDQLRSRDHEEAGDTKKFQMFARRIIPTWLLQFLLIIGLLASVVGYVGCFSVVQNSASSLGPVSWLCLEVGLSIMRLAIWALNPRADDAPPLEFIFELDKYEYEPLPTCNKDNREIKQHKVLPLTRAQDFLRTITSFTGLIKPFRNPDLFLYYTLTWNYPSRNRMLLRNGDNEPENAGNHEFRERILYITVFDHKERTTRVYTREDELDVFYSTKSDGPVYDVGHFLIEVEIDAKIDPKGDPVSSDGKILDSLREHHRLILEHIQYRLGDGDVTKTYPIYASWTMKVVNTTFSMLQRLRMENSNDWKTVVEKGRDKERIGSENSMISDYFMHSSIERERQLLYETRVKLIARRMDMITSETKERLLGIGVEYRVDLAAMKKPATKPREEVYEILGWEQSIMEELLVYEVTVWEQLFLKQFKAFLDQIDIDRVEEKKRLVREWTANCWKRLNPQMQAALKRLADLDDRFIKDLGKRWASLISQLFEGDNPDVISLSKLRREIRDKYEIDEEIRLRLENEIENTEFSLERGSDLGRFDPSQFWSDDTLLRCRYSRSKWLNFYPGTAVPLEVYLRALKENKNITHISFGRMNSGFDFNQFLCDLPWVTSISLYDPMPIRAIHRDHLFIKSANNHDDDLMKFAKEVKLDPPSTYIFADIGSSYSGKLTRDARVLISFVGPTSGKRLILRVKHSGEEDEPLEVILGSTKTFLIPSSQSSLTIDDITLYPIEISDYDRFSFMPMVRNDIFIRFIGTSHGHYIDDIELLDEAGLEYMPHLASLFTSD